MFTRGSNGGLLVLSLAALLAAGLPCPAQDGVDPPPAVPGTTSDDDTRVSDLEAAALSRGTPDIPGLNIVWLTPWINPALARDWTNIVVHQSEGAVGSAWRLAVAQQAKPDRRGVTVWVEADGTVIWAVAEFAVPGHTISNRRDNRYIDNAATFGRVNNDNSLGIEFVGNYPNVRKRPTDAQIRAWRILVRVLEIRYGIPREKVFAHNWISYKDRRYCEGCVLAEIAREPPPAQPLIVTAAQP
jgi:hypothetical protein